MTKGDLHQMINEFPLHHEKFVTAQEIMSSYFHRVAKFHWAESIQQELWQYVQGDFAFENGVELEE